MHHESNEVILKKMINLYNNGQKVYFSSYEFMNFMSTRRNPGESQCSFMKSELYKWWLQLPTDQVDFSRAYHNTLYFPIQKDILAKLGLSNTIEFNPKTVKSRRY